MADSGGSPDHLLPGQLNDLLARLKSRGVSAAAARADDDDTIMSVLQPADSDSESEEHIDLTDEPEQSERPSPLFLRGHPEVLEYYESLYPNNEDELANLERAVAAAKVRMAGPPLLRRSDKPTSRSSVVNPPAMPEKCYGQSSSSSSGSRDRVSLGSAHSLGGSRSLEPAGGDETDPIPTPPTPDTPGKNDHLYPDDDESLYNYPIESFRAPSMTPRTPRTPGSIVWSHVMSDDQLREQYRDGDQVDTLCDLPVAASGEGQSDSDESEVVKKKRSSDGDQLDTLCDLPVAASGEGQSDSDESEVVKKKRSKGKRVENDSDSEHQESNDIPKPVVAPATRASKRAAEARSGSKKVTKKAKKNVDDDDDDDYVPSRDEIEDEKAMESAKAKKSTTRNTQLDREYLPMLHTIIMDKRYIIMQEQCKKYPELASLLDNPQRNDEAYVKAVLDANQTTRQTICEELKNGNTAASTNLLFPYQIFLDVSILEAAFLRRQRMTMRTDDKTHYYHPAAVCVPRMVLVVKALHPAFFQVNRAPQVLGRVLGNILTKEKLKRTLFEAATWQCENRREFSINHCSRRIPKCLQREDRKTILKLRTPLLSARKWFEGFLETVCETIVLIHKRLNDITQQKYFNKALAKALINSANLKAIIEKVITNSDKLTDILFNSTNFNDDMPNTFWGSGDEAYWKCFFPDYSEDVWATRSTQNDRARQVDDIFKLITA